MSQDEKSAEDVESSSAAQQAARTELRESFLMAVNKLTGQSCKILTYEKTMLKATVAAWNPDTQVLLVRDLHTPANISVKSALLRPSDILSLQFDSDVFNII